MDIKVSVILPSLNVGKYIDECLKSVSAQTLKEIEILCIDAGSTDDTLSIITKYQEIDKRIKLLHSTQKSYGKQVNIGIDSARGDYIAIVETDDFIHTNMLMELYDMAITNDLDFAKGESEQFAVSSVGKKIGQKVTVLRGIGQYNVILSDTDMIVLQNAEYRIWNGIYKRDFLNKYKIRVNESAGAAYQDISFVQQLFCFAHRGMYSESTVYYYRVDRIESSSNQPYGLKYIYQELKWLCEENHIEEKISVEHLKALYIRIAVLFINESSKWALDGKNPVMLENEEKYYTWFSAKLNYALKQKLIGRENFNKDCWLKLRLLLYSFQGFKDYVVVYNAINMEYQSKIIENLQDKQVVIFGCGQYGLHLMSVLLDHFIEVLAFCDNDSAKWGQKIGEYQIMAPKECVQTLPTAFYYIAMKYHAEDVKEQLLALGIDQKEIRILRI